jgi:prepilin-type processing-associated H-X9-DG protein
LYFELRQSGSRVRLPWIALDIMSGWEQSRVNWASGRTQCGLAFTLIELVVVVAVLALLAVTLLPALAGTKPNAAFTICGNNLRQLGVGTMLYLADNKEIFPACASRNTYGFQPMDWIYWRTSLPQYPVQNSLILAPPGKATTNIFRCPADRDNTDRIALAASDPVNGAYNYSYSMTCYPISNGPNAQGMSSIVDMSGTIYPFHATSIRRPSGKIVFAEEQSVSHGPECSTPTANIINDGLWLPWGDVLTSRHYGKANVGFADGHVQAVDWKFGQNVTNSQANL